MLQYAALCHVVLRCVALCCTALMPKRGGCQHCTGSCKLHCVAVVALFCSMLHCVPLCCTVLSMHCPNEVAVNTALASVNCSVLHYVALLCVVLRCLEYALRKRSGCPNCAGFCELRCVALCCSMLHFATLCCTVLSTSC